MTKQDKIKELRNLEYNGWRVVDDSDLTELRNYLKH